MIKIWPVCAVTALTIVASILFTAPAAFADGTAELTRLIDNKNDSAAMAAESANSTIIRLTPDRTKVIRLDRDAASVIVTNPAHASVMLDSPRLLIVMPRQPGATSFTVLNAAGESILERDVIVTAAHCIHTDNGVNASARFTTADGRHQAQVTHYLIDPNFNYIRFNRGDEIDGLDWALLRLSAPLGDQVGYAGYLPRGASAAMGQRLMQAGYSWDTGENLSGNLDCRVLQANADNTFSHNCDTTRGDSGSAFVIRQSSPSSRSGYVVIGTDSNFRSNPGGPFIYIAVSSAAWATRAPDFIAGRTGTPVGQSAPGRK